MGGSGLCMHNPFGVTVKENGDRCENMLSPGTPFNSWCARDFDADIFSCIFNIVPHIMQTKPKSKSSKSLAATWISATYERHGDFLKQLMKHMKVDSMGKCFTNRKEDKHPTLQAKDPDGIWWGAETLLTSPNKGWRTTNIAKKLLIAAHYPFYLSLENTILDDYVTEKFYDGFLTDAVMVYLGAPNARAYAPAPHSFISALDFDGPEALAAFLTSLAADPPRLAAYQAWKRTRPVRVTPAFVEAMRWDLTALGNSSMLCRLCELVSGGPSAAAGWPAPRETG